MTPTEARLCSLVATRLDVDPQTVPLDAALTHELGLDSFDVVSLVVEIEDAFAPLSLAEHEAERLRTLRDVASYIDQSREGDQDERSR